MISKYILVVILFIAAALPASAETYLLKAKGSPNGTLEVTTIYESKADTQKVNVSEIIEVVADKNTQVSVKAIPKANFRVNNWTGAGAVASGAATVTFGMTEDKTVECSVVPGTNLVITNA